MGAAILVTRKQTSAVKGVPAMYTSKVLITNWTEGSYVWCLLLNTTCVRTNTASDLSFRTAWVNLTLPTQTVQTSEEVIRQLCLMIRYSHHHPISTALTSIYLVALYHKVCYKTALSDLDRASGVWDAKLCTQIVSPSVWVHFTVNRDYREQKRVNMGVVVT